LPTVPKESANVPPVWIVSIPVPLGPTAKFLAIAPGLVTSVEFGVTVSMFASVVCLGKPALQLPLKNQLEENCPVQSVWARVEIVDAAKTAIVASNVDKTNLQPARASDVAPRRGLVDVSGRGSRRISASNPSGKANDKNWTRFSSVRHRSAGELEIS